MRQVGKTLLAAAVFLATVSTAQAYDVSRFCQPDADEVVILVDVTTAFDDRSKEQFQRGISGIVQSLTPGEQLRIATIEESYASSKLLYAGCVPFCASGILDWLFSDCTEGVLRIETTRQLSEITVALQDRLKIATSDLDTSDIVRTIFYATEHRSNLKHLDLFVFSDLIENSEFMPGRLFWSQTPTTSIELINQNGLLPDLSNSTVRAFGVGRGGSFGRHPLTQDRIVLLRDFWSRYFAAARAEDTQVSEELYMP